MTRAIAEPGFKGIRRRKEAEKPLFCRDDAV